MAEDLSRAEKARPVEERKPSRIGSLFSRKSKNPSTSASISAPMLPKTRRVVDAQAAPIDPPTQKAASPYRQHFTRGLEKKGYLKSKLAIQLPRKAKLGAAIAILALIVAAPFLSRLSERPTPPTAGTIVTQGTEALVAQVARSIELPSGEIPLIVVATADDIRRLNVPDAKPGDKILVYQESGKIVVYDAEEDKVLGIVNRAKP